MIRKATILLLLALSFTLPVIAQGEPEPASADTVDEKDEFILKPRLGLGVGMLKFYGDVSDFRRGNPLVSNIGYDLSVSQDLNSFLRLRFYVLFGTLSANERSLDRNLNFKSQISTGGVDLKYNFGNFLNENRAISPYISVGIESMEFLSKTDKVDAFGNEYHYWSDGSIRNLPEDSPEAQEAQRIQRDYVYETDLRESNLDGFGKYPERTWAVPLGAGAVFHLSDRADFSVGTTLHMTFTDLIDNVSGESDVDRLGGLPGNEANDKFLMTSFSLTYDFMSVDEEEEEIEDPFEDTKILAVGETDFDNDGVIDFYDECPQTPDGVEIDEKGCPLDEDNDLVPDYRDEALGTPEGKPVLPTGKEFTDTLIYMDYLAYKDSVLGFAEIIRKSIEGERRKQKEYRVKIGEYTAGIDPSTANRFLSVPDVRTSVYGDSLTIFTVGKYDNLPEAIKRKIALTKEGFENAEVVTKEGEPGEFVSVGDEKNNMAVESDTESDPDLIEDVVFRVQVGAYKTKQPKSFYRDVPELLEIKTEDGYTKYLTGSFRDFKQAASRKIDVKSKGYDDAFIVAYKDGDRVSLRSVGISQAGIDESISKGKSEDEIEKDKIRFEVQVGIYKNEVPTEVLSKFMTLDDIKQTELESGLTRYSSGNFETYEAAEAYRNSLEDSGFKGAFIIALHDGEVISVNKAKSLINN